MGKVLDLMAALAAKARKSDAYANLERVLQKEILREQKWATNRPGIETGRKTRHTMAYGKQNPEDSDIFTAEFFRDKIDKMQESPFGGWAPSKITSEGPVKANLTRELFHDASEGMQIPTSLERALAKIRNKPNVFFADGSEI
jgi:hypothetical protein